jgi:hypothetical protein
MAYPALGAQLIYWQSLTVLRRYCLTAAPAFNIFSTAFAALVIMLYVLFLYFDAAPRTNADMYYVIAAV